MRRASWCDAPPAHCSTWRWTCNPVAMHLRAMNMLYEAIKEKGSMVIVPSSAVETMGLGAMTGLASLGGAKVGE